MEQIATGAVALGIAPQIVTVIGIIGVVVLLGIAAGLAVRTLE